MLDKLYGSEQFYQPGNGILCVLSEITNRKNLKYIRMRKKFFLMVNVEQKIALMMVWQLAMQNVLQMIGSTRKYLKPIPEQNAVVY